MWNFWGARGCSVFGFDKVFWPLYRHIVLLPVVVLCPPPTVQVYLQDEERLERGERKQLADQGGCNSRGGERRKAAAFGPCDDNTAEREAAAKVGIYSACHRHTVRYSMVKYGTVRTAQHGVFPALFLVLRVCFPPSCVRGLTYSLPLVDIFGVDGTFLVYIDSVRPYPFAYV